MTGVEVSAPGEDTVIVDHAVVIAKPGAAEFLTSFSLADATIAIDGNETVITGAVVDSARTNLRASFSTSSQSLVITEANIEKALIDGWFREQAIAYYNFGSNSSVVDSQIQVASLLASITGFDAEGNPQCVDGQDNVVDVIPGDEGYIDLWWVQLVTVPAY